MLVPDRRAGDAEDGEWLMLPAGTCDRDRRRPRLDQGKKDELAESCPGEFGTARWQPAATALPGRVAREPEREQLRLEGT